MQRYGFQSSLPGLTQQSIKKMDTRVKPAYDG
jgi:hypothetical protein